MMQTCFSVPCADDTNYLSIETADWIACPDTVLAFGAAGWVFVLWQTHRDLVRGKTMNLLPFVTPYP